MSERFDCAVVGAGILGLAHAWHLARAGKRVVVLERSPYAQGASLRNFGMIWPIGQPAGERRELALRSREHWRQVLTDAGLWHDPIGSLHVAGEDDEVAVLEDFLAGPLGETAGELLSPAEACRRSPGLRRDSVRAALFSPHEMLVDPREVLAELPAYLASRYGVSVRFGVLVRGFEDGVVKTSTEPVRAERLYVCSGSDLATLYPESLLAADLRPCKLQMLRTTPVEQGWRQGPMLAFGLTLAHYASFAHCPSLGALTARFEREYPEYRRHGIHVMAAQNGRGEVVIGDSHQWGDSIGPFDDERIDRLVLDYLGRYLRIPGMEIRERWHGIYVGHPERFATVLHPDARVTAITGVGGAGMTLSFGLAERVVAQTI